MATGKKLNQRQLDFLSTLATKVVVDEKTYMFIPHWIEVFPDGQARLHNLDNIPKGLRLEIEKMRS